MLSCKQKLGSVAFACNTFADGHAMWQVDCAAQSADLQMCRFQAVSRHL